MIHEEVSAQAARFVGHVCGVVAVAMAALTGWGFWQLVGSWSSGRLSMLGAVLVAVCAALTCLFFRWAGVLTGYWSTGGRLSVPHGVYAGFGVLCGGATLAGLYMLVTHPLPVWWTMLMTFATLSAGSLAYGCALLLKNRRR